MCACAVGVGVGVKQVAVVVLVVEEKQVERASLRHDPPEWRGSQTREQRGAAGGARESLGEKSCLPRQQRPSPNLLPSKGLSGHLCSASGSFAYSPYLRAISARSSTRREVVLTTFWEARRCSNGRANLRLFAPGSCLHETRWPEGQLARSR